jgi:hypothetical protein
MGHPIRLILSQGRSRYASRRNSQNRLRLTNITGIISILRNVSNTSTILIPRAMNLTGRRA